MADIILTEKDVERFWAKTRRNPDTGCLEWVAALTPLGYGIFGWGRRSWRAHRIAWIVVEGRIPIGQNVLHRCDNRKCVERGHLYLGSQAQNVSDMVARGRHACQKATHCPYGHPYSGENLITRPQGHRDCRVCSRRRNAAFKLRRAKNLCLTSGV